MVRSCLQSTTTRPSRLLRSSPIAICNKKHVIQITLAHSCARNPHNPKENNVFIFVHSPVSRKHPSRDQGPGTRDQGPGTKEQRDKEAGGFADRWKSFTRLYGLIARGQERMESGGASMRDEEAARENTDSPESASGVDLMEGSPSRRNTIIPDRHRL